MPFIPRNRALMSQVILPVTGWTAACLGVALSVMAFFPPPPPAHSILDYIGASSPMVGVLVGGMSLILAGLTMVAGSKLAANNKSTDSLESESSNPSRSWSVLGSYVDQTMAESLAELLRKEEVPAKVKIDSPVPGLVQSVCIIVPENLFDRAKRIINQEPVA